MDGGNETHSAPATRWHLRMPGGPVYGPADWAEICQWAGEGRIVHDCELAETRHGPWRKAADLLPLPAARPRAFHSDSAAVTSYPWATGGPEMPAGGYVAPHRGGLILMLGLMSFLGCPLLSFAAWIMGSHDLREMRVGRMDKSGHSATWAGMVFGIIVSGLWMLAGAVLALGLFLTAITR